VSPTFITDITFQKEVASEKIVNNFVCYSKELDDQNSIPGSSRNLPILQHVETSSVVHPAFSPVQEQFTSAVTQPREREADHTLQSSANVKNYLSSPRSFLNVWL